MLETPQLAMIMVKHHQLLLLLKRDSPVSAYCQPVAIHGASPPPPPILQFAQGSLIATGTSLAASAC